MAAEEGYISSTLHADTATVRLLDLHDFALQVPEPVHGRHALLLLLLPHRVPIHIVHRRQWRCLFGHLLSRTINSPLNQRATGQTLFHPPTALAACNLVAARIKQQQRHQFIAHNALLRIRCLQNAVANFPYAYNRGATMIVIVITMGPWRMIVIVVHVLLVHIQIIRRLVLVVVMVTRGRR